MRARSPDQTGFVEQNQVRIGYEVFGAGQPTFFLLPTWTIIHSRFWKMQVPYLAEHFRVVTYDGPGNGRSSRPMDPEGYSQEAQVGYAVAVQGGLSTTMELVAARRPFVYFPLRKHWEQVYHVAHRLNHYRAGLRLDYAQTTPADLAKALQRLLSQPVDYRPVEPGGAARAARRIAELI